MARDRNVEHQGENEKGRRGELPENDKIKPNGIVATKPGPTITLNDPAKFGSKGKVEGKTKSAKTVINEAEGPTITCNRTHIETPNADMKPQHKQIAEANRGVGYRVPDTAGKLTATQTGEGGPTDRAYGLKSRYDKKAGTDGNNSQGRKTTRGDEESHKARLF